MIAEVQQGKLYWGQEVTGTFLKPKIVSWELLYGSQVYVSVLVFILLRSDLIFVA